MGTNSFEIEAFDVAGNVAGRTLTVERSPPAPEPEGTLTIGQAGLLVATLALGALSGMAIGRVVMGWLRRPKG